MNIKEVLKPTLMKIIGFLIALIAEFFILPVLGLLRYSPKMGAEYYPVKSFCTLFQMFFVPYVGSCRLYYGTIIYLIIAIGLTYFLVCYTISKLSKK